jgi:hypothetical protein
VNDASDTKVTDRVGVLFALCDEPSLVARAEELGYESAWAAEGQGSRVIFDLYVKSNQQVNAPDR